MRFGCCGLNACSGGIGIFVQGLACADTGAEADAFAAGGAVWAWLDRPAGSNVHAAIASERHILRVMAGARAAAWALA
jgi:hypothetical protein